MKTALEKATVAAGEALRQSDFGVMLRTFRDERRRAHGTGWSWLTAIELNQGPPIQRALTAGAILKVVGKQDSLTSQDDEYLEWTSKGRNAMQRIAAKCWAPIPATVRTVIVDEDDLPDPLGHGYIRNARVSSFGDPLSPVGINTLECRTSLKSVWTEAKQTAAFRGAAESGVAVASSPSLAARLGELRAGALKQFQPLSTGETLGDAERRARDLIKSMYTGEAEPVQKVARSIRAYNRLVQHLMWAILGLAERPQPFPPIEDTAGPVRVGHTDEGIGVTVSYWGDDRLWFPDLTEPFELGSPLRGTYLTTGFSVSFAGREIIDLTGTRLGSLEDGSAP